MTHYRNFDSSCASCMSGGSDEVVSQVFTKTAKKKLAKNKNKVSKELYNHYSKLLIDTYNVIDAFVQNKLYLYGVFSAHFDSMDFQQIYEKCKMHTQQIYSPSDHNIAVTQDLFTVASMFLRSKSRDARIGAIFLLYTLVNKQPMETRIKININNCDFELTTELVKQCVNEGAIQPLYCFMEMTGSKCIEIVPGVINPCFDAYFPKSEIEKYMDHRTTDSHVQNKSNRSRRGPFPRNRLPQEVGYLNKSTHDIEAEPQRAAMVSKLMEYLQINDEVLGELLNRNQVFENTTEISKKNDRVPPIENAITGQTSFRESCPIATSFNFCDMVLQLDPQVNQNLFMMNGKFEIPKFNRMSAKSTPSSNSNDKLPVTSVPPMPKELTTPEKMVAAKSNADEICTKRQPFRRDRKREKKCKDVPDAGLPTEP